MVELPIPLAGFRIPKPWISDSTDQNYLESGFRITLHGVSNYIQRIRVNTRVEHLQTATLLGTAWQCQLNSQIVNSWHLCSITSYKCCVTHINNYLNGCWVKHISVAQLPSRCFALGKIEEGVAFSLSPSSFFISSFIWWKQHASQKFQACGSTTLWLWSKCSCSSSVRGNMKKNKVSLNFSHQQPLLNHSGRERGHTSLLKWLSKRRKQMKFRLDQKLMSIHQFLELLILEIKQ